jgi:pyruvate-ferredoxin/flavodoxin oxidoreductase
MGRGPAWSNSLFEDNAEFGLGIRLAIDARRELAERMLHDLREALDPALVAARLDGAGARDEGGIEHQRERLEELRELLFAIQDPRARTLETVAEALVPSTVWIVGGDGWAYDIGFGGLDHVLASDANVNVLVLDTEVYSNTGGQASKATPRGAVAKFAAAGKPTGKKDLGQIATAYGHVYVGQIALGADMPHTVKVLAEAEAHPGPSLVIAYSTCIAHGIDMSTSMHHQKEAVDSGYWPLWRFDPGRTAADEHPFVLDSKAPKTPLSEFVRKEARFAMLERTDPERARRLLRLAQADVDERWRLYEQLAGIERGPEPAEQPQEEGSS